MRRPSFPAVLLLIGGVLFAVGLPMQWSSVVFTDGTNAITLRGLDYAGYDVVTTLLLALLLVFSGLVVASGRRWGSVLGVTASLLAALWGVLVVIAAANPSDNGTPITVANVTIGVGAWVVLCAAVLALIGSVMSFRGRNAAVIRSGAASSV